MGKLTGWGLSLPTTNKCSNCGMQKKNQKGCCNDKQKTFQLKKDQLTTQVNVVPDNTFQYSDNSYPSSENIFTAVHAGNCYAAHSPPGLKIISPFILNCVFRI
jgi:hypothetical protein